MRVNLSQCTSCKSKLFGVFLQSPSTCCTMAVTWTRAAPQWKQPAPPSLTSSPSSMDSTRTSRPWSFGLTSMFLWMGNSRWAPCFQDVLAKSREPCPRTRGRQEAKSFTFCAVFISSFFSIVVLLSWGEVRHGRQELREAVFTMVPSTSKLWRRQQNFDTQLVCVKNGSDYSLTSSTEEEEADVVTKVKTAWGGPDCWGQSNIIKTWANFWDEILALFLDCCTVPIFSA